MTRPLSVCDSDATALAKLLTIHAPDARHILDCTWGRGSIWRNLLWGGAGTAIPPFLRMLDPRAALFDCRVVRSDLQSPGDVAVDVAADYLRLPFRPGVFDVVVWDPPHTADGGKNGVMGGRYGTQKGGGLKTQIPAFLSEGARVLRPGGAVLVKLVNGVHDGRFHNWARAFLNAAESVGLEQIDEAMVVRRNRISDPRWKQVLHLRGAHVYWLAVQKGRRG